VILLECLKLHVQFLDLQSHYLFLVLFFLLSITVLGQLCILDLLDFPQGNLFIELLTLILCLFDYIELLCGTATLFGGRTEDLIA
jgi:hypothetical protein